MQGLISPDNQTPIMSLTAPKRTPSTSLPPRRGRARSLATPGTRAPTLARRPSVSGIGLTGTINPVTGAPKAQRTSKTTQKLVLLPTAPQTKPLPPPLLIGSEEEDLQHGYETDTGIRDIKSLGERMNKEERKKAGFKRMTAYCVCESFKMKLLASFLKREHNVRPRVFDDAMHAVSSFRILLVKLMIESFLCGFRRTTFPYSRVMPQDRTSGRRFLLRQTQLRTRRYISSPRQKTADF